MLAPIRRKLTFSNVIACLALFIALGGAAVAAGLAKNSVGTKQLKPNAVTAAKIKNGAINSHKLAHGAVVAGKYGASSIASGALLNEAVTAAKLAKNSVTNNKLGNDAVTTAKLADGSVTNGKLGPEVAPLLGTLKPGQTLRGGFAVGGTGTSLAFDGQSFQFPLLARPEAEVVEPPATTAKCPGITGGNGETPQAAAGALCLYVTKRENVGLSDPRASAVTRLGFAVEAAGAGAGNFWVFGQWAVTAP